MHIFLRIMIQRFCVNDILEMKKSHPCGGVRFKVLFVGSDVKIRCETCNHELIIPRIKLEKKIKRIISE